MLHVSNRKNFTSHVKAPAMAVLVTIGMFIGIFTNVYLYGNPITLFVAGAFFMTAGAIFSTIKEEDF